MDWERLFRAVVIFVMICAFVSVFVSVILVVPIEIIGICVFLIICCVLVGMIFMNWTKRGKIVATKYFYYAEDQEGRNRLLAEGDSSVSLEKIEELQQLFVEFLGTKGRIEKWDDGKHLSTRYVYPEFVSEYNFSMSFMSYLF